MHLYAIIVVIAGGVATIIGSVYAVVKLVGSLVKIAATAEDVKTALPTLLVIADTFESFQKSVEAGNKTLNDLWKYTHAFKHDIIQILQVVALGNEVLAKLQREIGETPENPPTAETSENRP